jgi:hypothetical protein
VKIYNSIGESISELVNLTQSAGSSISEEDDFAKIIGGLIRLRLNNFIIEHTLNYLI